MRNNYNSEYIKQIVSFMKANNAKASSVEFRRKVLQRQRAANVQMEADRINGVLANSILNQTNPNYRRLKNRAKELKELGAKAFDRAIED